MLALNICFKTILLSWMLKRIYFTQELQWKYPGTLDLYQFVYKWFQLPSFYIIFKFSWMSQLKINFTVIDIYNASQFWEKIKCKKSCNHLTTKQSILLLPIISLSKPLLNFPWVKITFITYYMLHGRKGVFFHTWMSLKLTWQLDTYSQFHIL